VSAMAATAIELATLAPGFPDPVHAPQAVFRAVLAALSRPGVAATLELIAAPDGLDPAATAVLLALCDHETPVHLAGRAATRAAADHLRFHAGAPITDDPANASFAVCDGPGAAALLPRLPIGEDRYPDRSATLIVMLPALTGGAPIRLNGPGIETVAVITPGSLGVDFWRVRDDIVSLFPLGVDIVLASGTTIVGLPRAVRAHPEA
jgi:alpha-D-ribose 1-methylphosphonate 5-triphosphate synthase subunit PhnH